MKQADFRRQTHKYLLVRIVRSVLLVVVCRYNADGVDRVDRGLAVIKTYPVPKHFMIIFFSTLFFAIIFESTVKGHLAISL